jgi:mannose-6-phosphate isomerase-like protein (cupin superfamily)
MRVHNWKHPVSFVAPEKSEPVLECEEAVVKCLYIDLGQEAKPHVHSTSVDVMVMVHGTGTAPVDGKERSVGPGDVFSRFHNTAVSAFSGLCSSTPC